MNPLGELIPISPVTHHAFYPRRAWLEAMGETNDTHQMAHDRGPPRQRRPDTITARLPTLDGHHQHNTGHLRSVPLPDGTALHRGTALYSGTFAAESVAVPDGTALHRGITGCSPAGFTAGRRP